MVTFHPEAITPECTHALKLLSDQAFLADYYLAGGTALALLIGHRISADLDWFTPSRFLLSNERDAIRFSLAKTGSFQVIREQDGQVYARLANAHVSFVHQPHPLVEPTVPYNGLRLASPVDIGLMKLAAINSRGTRRDFIDLYCLRNLASLERLTELAETKYADRPSFLDISARALAYFADAEQQPMPRLLWNDLSWTDIVRYCEAGAKSLTQRMRDRHK
jgi:predicted nucleotidyltransferase component of viral defense system